MLRLAVDAAQLEARVQLGPVQLTVVARVPLVEADLDAAREPGDDGPAELGLVDGPVAVEVPRRVEPVGGLGVVEAAVLVGVEVVVEPLDRPVELRAGHRRVLIDVHVVEGGAARTGVPDRSGPSVFTGGAAAHERQEESEGGEGAEETVAFHGETTTQRPCQPLDAPRRRQPVAFRP